MEDYHPRKPAEGEVLDERHTNAAESMSRLIFYEAKVYFGFYVHWCQCPCLFFGKDPRNNTMAADFRVPNFQN
jgi:hypothetical protein